MTEKVMTVGTKAAGRRENVYLMFDKDDPRMPGGYMHDICKDSYKILSNIVILRKTNDNDNLLPGMRHMHKYVATTEDGREFAIFSDYSARELGV